MINALANDYYGGNGQPTSPSGSGGFSGPTGGYGGNPQPASPEPAPGGAAGGNPQSAPASDPAQLYGQFHGALDSILNGGNPSGGASNPAQSDVDQKLTGFQNAIQGAGSKFTDFFNGGSPSTAPGQSPSTDQDGAAKRAFTGSGGQAKNSLLTGGA